MRNHLQTGPYCELCLFSPGQLCWLSDAGEVLSSFVFYQSGFSLYVLRCLLLDGAGRCPLSVDPLLADCHGRPVSDHGAGPGEGAASEQRLTEQWNDAEATYMAFVDRVSMMVRCICTDKPLRGLLLPQMSGS